MHLVLVRSNLSVCKLHKYSWAVVHVQPGGSVRCKGLFLLIRQLVVAAAAAVWLRLQAAVGLGGDFPTVSMSCTTAHAGVFGGTLTA